MAREWAVVDRGRVVTDPDWECPADVIRGAHHHDTHGPVDIAYRDTGDEIDAWILLRTCNACGNHPVRLPEVGDEPLLDERLHGRPLYCRDCSQHRDPLRLHVVRGDA